MDTRLNQFPLCHPLPPNQSPFNPYCGQMGRQTPGGDLSKAISRKFEAKAQVSFRSLTHVHLDARPPATRKYASLSRKTTKSDSRLHSPFRRGQASFQLSPLDDLFLKLSEKPKAPALNSAMSERAAGAFRSYRPHLVEDDGSAAVRY